MEALQNSEADFDPKTQLYNISMFPACSEVSKQVAICELDSRASIVQRVSLAGDLHIHTYVDGRRNLLTIDNQFDDFTPLNAPEGKIIAE